MLTRSTPVLLVIGFSLSVTSVLQAQNVFVQSKAAEQEIKVRTGCGTAFTPNVGERQYVISFLSLALQLAQHLPTPAYREAV
jgi:hypothetical protein